MCRRSCALSRRSSTGQLIDVASSFVWFRFGLLIHHTLDAASTGLGVCALVPWRPCQGLPADGGRTRCMSTVSLRTVKSILCGLYPASFCHVNVWAPIVSSGLHTRGVRIVRCDGPEQEIRRIAKVLRLRMVTSYLHLFPLRFSLSTSCHDYMNVVFWLSLCVLARAIELRAVYSRPGWHAVFSDVVTRLLGAKMILN